MRLVAVEVDAPAENEVELVAQALDQAALGGEIAQRSIALQVHELASIDPRLRLDRRRRAAAAR